MIRILAFALLLVGSASAQEADQQMRAMNNFVHEHINCAAFYAIGSQCVRGRPDGKKLADDLMQSSAAAFSRGTQYGDAINLSRKTHDARLSLGIDSMMDEMEKDCRNISVILAKHAKSCQRLMNEPQDVLSDLLAGKPLQ